MRNASSGQKQIENANPSLLKSFKASSQLHQQLSKDYKRAETSSVSRNMFVSTGKELLKQAHIEKELQRTQPTFNKTQISLESEVIALSNYQKPQIRDQTRELIAKQKESRRERHIKATKEFEKWVERLTKNIDEAYKEIKSDVIGFFEDSDQQINTYYEQLTDPVLLQREIDFVDELKNIISSHKEKRDQKVSNLDQRLDDLETERQRSLTFFCDRYFGNLMDIAFILEPEITELVNEERKVFQNIVEEHKVSNKVYVQEVNQRQTDTFVKYEQLRQEKEQHWRELKHKKYIELFQIDIKKWEYVNPQKRIQLYKEFKSTQIEIYDCRMKYLEKLGNLEVSALAKVVVEKWLEEVKNYNEKASSRIDSCFDNLMKESEDTNNRANIRYEELCQGIYYAGSQTKEELTKILEEEFLPIIKSLNDNARELMTKGIKYVEGIDLQQMDILNNFGAFFLKIAQSNDEYRRQLQVNKHNYELEKAQSADKNDESIEKLNGEFDQLKVKLSQALHHPKLQESLDDCFAKLDQIEQEYRAFHEANMAITKRHPDAIDKQHLSFEKTLANYFQLLGDEKKAELVFKYEKIAMEKAKKILAKEEYFKKQEEEKQAEEAKNKKGGKAPASKAKDPKKAAQEQEERLNQILKEVGASLITEFKSPLKQNFLEYKSMKEIVERMYFSTDDQEKFAEKDKEDQLKLEQEMLNQGQAQAKVDPKAKQPQQTAVIELPEYKPEDDIPPKPVDFKNDPPIDPQGNVVFSKDVVIEVTFVVGLLQKAKVKVFEYVHVRLEDNQEEAKIQDKEFLENSILILDDRLKLHYPLKGKAEVEIFQVRSSQITIHKKRYERYAKTSYERIDYQTEQFNFFIEGALLDLKEYEKEQKSLRESLSSANTLAKFQGIQNTVKENYFKFGEKINEVMGKLGILTTNELDFIAQKNKDFIKECKPFDQGGDYANEEIQWYQDMMKDIDEAVQRARDKRKLKNDELSKLLSTKKQYQLDQFEKEYAVAVEELAAKDGTGKKYGRPKRLAQERLRTEMTKCEKAQDCIQAKLEKLKQMYQQFQTNKTNSQYFQDMQAQLDFSIQFSSPSFSLQVRRVLMGLLTCIRRYSTHIEALKSDAKVQDMPRITYNEEKFDTVLEAENQELDQKFIEEDLESMGPLYFQKDQRKFLEWVLDIEKNIKEEAVKIYSGDKAKYLTGADKIPDYLRSYIEQMKKNMDDFKTQSIRDLRNSCENLSEFAEQISEMILYSISLKYNFRMDSDCSQIFKDFEKKRKGMEKTKEVHQQQLRPNLGNPQCKDELDELCGREKTRLTNWMQEIKDFRQKLLESQFINSNALFKGTLQNFEFLLIYYDSLVLFEDFVKLPGDEQIQKKHQNLKVNLRQKQSGQVVDTSSERSLSKEWQGTLIDIFRVENMTVAYVWQANAVVVQEKDAKGKDKKQDKKGADKKEQQQESTESQSVTKSLKSFKTFRQKSASHFFGMTLKEFKDKFDKKVMETQKVFKVQLEKEMKFEFKWEQNVSSLTIGN